MTFIVIPHEIGATTAALWVGAICEGDVPKRPVRFDLNGEPRSIMGEWEPWQTFEDSDPEGYAGTDRFLHAAVTQDEPVRERLYYQRVKLENLVAGTEYGAAVIVDEQTATGTERRLRSCSFRTLPGELPHAGDDNTFNILLGSCFYMPRDPRGMVGRTFAALPEGHRPHVKFLCGDQVYLDNPWYETTFKWYRGNKKPGVFREMLLEKYLDTWTQSPDEEHGFNRLLTEGANYFCSDDHEFWNNAPNFGGVGLANTFTAGQRGWWFYEGRKLFRAFQSCSSLQGFEVGNLSVRSADTRIDRDAQGGSFMLYEDLKEVRKWLASLEGPGVLVLGQPLLEADAPETWKDKINSHFDKDLADYSQYAELKQSILDCSHSLVVLTGDVHFGRVASIPPGSDGVTNFVEVISSPMCHVTGATVSGYEPALRLGAEEMESTDPFGGEHRDHFATVRFSKEDNGILNMFVSYWPIASYGTEIPQEPAATFEFKLA